MATSTRFFLGMEDYVEQLNLLDDAVNTGAFSPSLSDSAFEIFNATTSTKKAKFSAANITAGQTRTFSWPDVSGTVALTASPVFTGTPTAPTATVGTNSTQIATMAAIIEALAASKRLHFGTGAPASVLGIDGDGYLRLDKPYLGALYIKASGAWALADNSYTMAALPTASAAYLGAIATVVDATYCPEGEDFQCVTYDGGTSYYWVPVSKRWTVLKSASKDTAEAGTNTDVTITGFNFNLPNRADFYAPGMDIWIRFEGVAVGANGAKSFQVKALAMNGGTSSTLAGMGGSTATVLSCKVENIIHVTAANAGYSHPFTSFTSNVSTATQTQYSGTNWANLAITFTKNGVSALDTVQGTAREIMFIYP